MKPQSVTPSAGHLKPPQLVPKWNPLNIKNSVINHPSTAPTTPHPNRKDQNPNRIRNPIIRKNKSNKKKYYISIFNVLCVLCNAIGCIGWWLCSDSDMGWFAL
jgi:hypothetical protein